MFYLRYLRSELVRRRARTILTLTGLAIGVALVIAISGVSRGLDRAQKTALDPLSTIGTDLTVTLSPQQDTGGFGPGGGGGGRDLLQANQSAVTDLSKLGKPGQHFVHDFFLPGTQLTFPQKQTAQISSLPGVSSVTTGLVLSAVHQEGVVPKIVAKIKTGGQQIDVFRRIKPPTAAEAAKIQACLVKAGAGASPTQPAQPGGFGGGGGGGGRGGGLFNSAAARKCLPARMQQFRATITTPQQTLQQLVDPPQTNITSSSYTIAGVDPSQSAIGLVTPSQVTRGRYLSNGNDALLAATYAKRHALKIGSKLDLNGTTFRVVGLVKPPLGGQSADVYVPLSELQKLASQNGLANVILVRATSSNDVASVQKEIEQKLGSGAQVASAKQVADSINGSLVDAANLSHNLGLVLAIVAAAAAFLLAVLLTLSSVGKRVREIGTLKALGWSQRLVVRQIVAECLATAVVGGLVGVGLGIAAAGLVGVLGPNLSASTTTGGGDALFGLGQALSRTATTSVSLDAPLTLSLLALGFGLALAGGLIAGTAGALRAARLRPADALRQVE